MKIVVWFEGNTFAKKEELKELGAKWDGEQKIWFMSEIPARNIEGLNRKVKIYIESEDEINVAIDILSKEYENGKKTFRKCIYIQGAITIDLTKVAQDQASVLRKKIKEAVINL